MTMKQINSKLITDRQNIWKQRLWLLQLVRKTVIYTREHGLVYLKPHCYLTYKTKYLRMKILIATVGGRDDYLHKKAWFCLFEATLPFNMLFQDYNFTVAVDNTLWLQRVVLYWPFDLLCSLIKPITTFSAWCCLVQMDKKSAVDACLSCSRALLLQAMCNRNDANNSAGYAVMFFYRNMM